MNQEIQNPSRELVDVPSLCKRSWAVFAQKPFEHLVASLIVFVLSAVSLGILLGPMTIGQIRMIDKQQRGEPITIQDVFLGFRSFGSALLLTLIIFVCAAIGLSLLVLPGLFVLAAWAFAYYFIALRDSSLSEALGGSWNLLKTHTASVLVVLLLVVVFNAVAGTVVFATLLSAPLSAIFCLLAFQAMTEADGPVPGAEY